MEDEVFMEVLNTTWEAAWDAVAEMFVPMSSVCATTPDDHQERVWYACDYPERSAEVWYTAFCGCWKCEIAEQAAIAYFYPEFEAGGKYLWRKLQTYGCIRNLCIVERKGK